MPRRALRSTLVLICMVALTLPAFAQDTTPIPTQQPTIQPTPTTPPSDLIFSAEPGPDVTDLHDLSAGATDDGAIVTAAVNYFYENADRLSLLWREDDLDRLKAIYSMYLIHISTPYGPVEVFPPTMIDYMAETYGHCGTYTWAQVAIARGLGLRVRTVEFVGEHAWMEADIHGRWELFDATTNVWIDQPVEVLLTGAPRQYRTFYTPLLDVNVPEARAHIDLGFNMQRLRVRMPTIGIGYFPPGEMLVGEVAASWGE